MGAVDLVLAVADVLQNGPREQFHFLRHHCNLFAQAGLGYVADILAIN